MKKIPTLLLTLCGLLALYYYQKWSPEEKSVHQDAPWQKQDGSWQKVVEYAKANLPQEGKLVAKSDGFVYLKVDDNYIHALFPMLGLENKGFREPPYFRSPQSPGAHISVFNEDENVKPEEIGKSFHFEPIKILIIRTSKDTYAVLQVSSPELEELRKKYGLSPKLQGHDFHISIAKKKH